MAATITECVKQLTDSSDYARGVSSEKQVYLVTVAQADATPYEVRVANHANMPEEGSTHPIDELMIAYTKTARRAVGSNGKVAKYLWVVEVTYSTAPLVVFQRPTGETANSKNIRVNVTTVKSTVYTQVASDDSQIKNAVGDLYPDPQEKIIRDTRIEVTFDSNSFDLDGMDDLKGCVNDSSVTLTLPQGDTTYSRTFATGTLLLDDGDYEVVVDSLDPSTTTTRIRIALAYRVDGWARELPEKGYRYKDASGNLTEWKDTAAYLASDGQKLGAGAAVVKTAPIKLEPDGALDTLLATI